MLFLQFKKSLKQMRVTKISQSNLANTEHLTKTVMHINNK